MSYVRFSSTQMLQLQLKYRAFLILLVAFWLVSVAETWAKTSKTMPRSGSPGTLASASTSRKNVQKSSARKSRRHRRLKISRSLKPMPALSEAPFSADVPLLKLIEDAKSQLEKETVRYIAVGGKSTARRDVKFALAHFKTGEIQIVSGVEQNRKLTLNDPNVRFEVDWWNGFNSSITIIDPPYTGVVAMLYALEPERQRFLNQDAIIYTPYSSALLQTELVEAGKNYLMEKIRQARQELGHVPSRAFPGMSLANAPGFSDEDYFNLILTEQMDPGRFRSIAAGTWEFNEQQESELKRLAERILVIIGANQEDAYSFTGNYASARGLTQFTPMGMSVSLGRLSAGRDSAGFPRSYQPTSECDQGGDMPAGPRSGWTGNKPFGSDWLGHGNVCSWGCLQWRSEARSSWTGKLRPGLASSCVKTRRT